MSKCGLKDYDVLKYIKNLGMGIQCHHKSNPHPWQYAIRTN